MAKAIVSKVLIGRIEIDGLMLPDGSFEIGVPQVTTLFRFDTNQASRALKPLLGEGFRFDKASSELNSKAVNILSLPQFELVLTKLAFSGNQSAQELMLSLVGLSIHQLFCDAFEIKFNQEDRQEWLRVRQESKALFWQLTQQIQCWIENRECSQPEHFYYSTALDALSLHLFGKKSKEIKFELGIGQSALNRDHFGRTALRRIMSVQEQAAFVMARDRKIKPTDAIKQVVQSCAIPVCSYLD
jgi:hypothetical protein